MCSKQLSPGLVTVQPEQRISKPHAKAILTQSQNIYKYLTFTNFSYMSLL